MLATGYGVLHATSAEGVPLVQRNAASGHLATTSFMRPSLSLQVDRRTLEARYRGHP